MEDHMKTRVFVLITMAFSLLIACQAYVDIKAEEEAIKALAQKESTSFYSRDYEAWADCWWHDASIMHINAGTFSYSEIVGWDSWDAQLKKDYFKTEQEFPKINVEWADWHIKVGQNMAWASFHATEKLASSQDTTEPPQPKRELRIAEKRDGQWKLTCVVAISKDDPENAEGNFHNAAYKFYFNLQKPKEAIECLQLCAKLYPDGYTAYNFMGYIYSQTGEKKLAIENFKKSLELNPANEDAKQWLEKLK